MDDQARFYRRRLPHWRERCAVYLVTWRLRADQQELSSAERELICSELRHRDGERYRVHAYVVMNDHVHVLVEPFAGQILEKVVHSWKSFTAHRLQRQYGRQGRIWQEEYFDRVVRDAKEFDEKLRYIVNNPWRRWPGLVEYSWVWPQPEDL